MAGDRSLLEALVLNERRLGGELRRRRFRAWTWGATLWTLAIEGALAVAFLAPAWITKRFRDPLLLTFCAVTYAFAPVGGVAWLLLSMGLAQAQPARGTTAAYLGVALLVLVYDQDPWRWLA